MRGGSQALGPPFFGLPDLQAAWLRARRRVSNGCKPGGVGGGFQVDDDNSPVVSHQP